MKKLSLKIKGMHCASCAANIKISLERNPAIKFAEVNFALKKAIIEYEEDQINLEQIHKIIIKTGYDIDDDNLMSDEQKQNTKLKFKVLASIILALPLLLHMVWAWEVPGSLFGVSLTNWIQHDLAFVIVFFLGWQFHTNAWTALKNKQTDMDSLISLGTLAAYGYSTYAMFTNGHIYFESAATITALILLGRFLEQKTQNRASNALKKLLELGVKTATLITTEGKELTKGVQEIKVGQTILVKPGEKIPLDGIILKGHSSIDESMLTGESIPANKEMDDEVFAATINLDSVLQIEVTRDGANTVYQQIINTVEEAQKFKAPVQKLADRVASIFVPVVVGIALLTFIGWVMTGAGIGTSILYAVSVLVISCPCALGIATPIAILVGSSVGAKNGILIKNGESFEKAKQIQIALFDKTGTLTEGKPRVDAIAINPKANIPEDKVIKIAHSLARSSTHPISKAIIEFGKEKNIEPVTINGFQEIGGRGLKGTCQEHSTKILLGNKKLFQENNMEMEWINNTTDKYRESEFTILFIGHGPNVIGAFLLADKLKQTAKEAIKNIIMMDIEPMIISGDNKHVVARTADAIGVQKFLAEVLPTDKQKEVAKLQQAGKRVLFAGDGINDAPALVQADLGIAMAGGTDIAKESGDIIIMKNEPQKIVEAIKLSAKTFKVIKQNLFWAFFYNVLAIPLAVFGFVNPMIAALAMSFSDLTVIGNALRIYKK